MCIRDRVKELMANTSTVACFGSRALMSLFISSAPSADSIVGAVTTEDEGVAWVQKHRPTFLFATENLEAGDGLSLVQRVHAITSSLRTLLILQEESQEKVCKALQLGCNGVVVEDRIASGTMVEAIRAVIGGGIYADNLSTEALRSTKRGEEGSCNEPLTEREREVLQWLVRGYSNREMAEELVVSAETIKSHVANTLSKLQAKDRTHAAVIGLRLGLAGWE